MNYLALLCAMVAVVNAADTEISLRGKITNSLEAHLESQGIQNCDVKCNTVFDKFAYAIATTGDEPTYEYQACLIGCNNCTSDIADNAPSSACFTGCKDFDFAGVGIFKGVIEPDKACIAGCIIQTCQSVCTGGTTANTETKANAKFWFPNGGCSIKTEPYAQNSQYVPFNSPNSGQAGSSAVAQCCSNAVPLCPYVGDTSSTNYANLLYKTQQFCKKFVPSGTATAICAFYGQAQNCGQF